MYKKNISEWTKYKQWNPFNSYKLLAHVDRWKRIQRGAPIPAPVLITVDPTNICNFECAWCNARYVREHRNFSLTETTLLRLADFLPRWGITSGYEKGVKAVCVAGGGEPLLNPATSVFIDSAIQHGVEVGVVTNGSYIQNHIEALSKCTWVGCSIDAGTPATFNKLKGLPENSEIFNTIISNISQLVEYSKIHATQLGKPFPSYGVSYKFLLYKDNISEMYAAARLAKSIGCKSIHFRPAGTTWDKIGTDNAVYFSDEDIQLFHEQITKVFELDDSEFGVFGITHKFNEYFKPSNCFDECYAVFMTAVISPRQDKHADKDSFTMGLCCDRRGDPKLELLKDCCNIEDIEHIWGNEKHWDIFDSIDISKECPRCTYMPHNNIYKHVILEDSMTYKFI